MSIRAIRGCFFFLAFAIASASAAELSLVRVFTGWRDGASFKRISEYFNGKENTGDATILRTHPEQRTGYYFLLRVANPGAPLQVQFQLQLIEPGASVQRTTVFPAEIRSGSGVFQLGLTGPEWQDAKSQPVAWQVLVIAPADGRILASEKSYLWEKPAAK
ncbi:MAG: hypothetical protein HYX71_07720 [Opitutae bacterium]|nr:hypothetical protein [Opitutae bacterium]